MIGIIVFLSLAFVLLMTYVIPGVNFFLWVLLYLFVIYLLNRGLHFKSEKIQSSSDKVGLRSTMKLLLPGLLISSLLLYRTNLLVLFLVIFLSMVLLYLFPGVGKVRADIFGSVKLLLSPILFGIGWLKDGIKYLRTNSSNEKDEGKDSSNYNNLLIGVLLSVPFLFIFTLLFYIGDSSFAGQLNNIGESINYLMSNFDLSKIALDEVIFRIVDFLIIFILLIPVLYATLNRNSSLKDLNEKVDGYLGRYNRDLTVSRWSGFLIPIILLFVLFIFTQIDYLYGGVGNVIGDEAKYTFAEYARRGFVELSIVTFIVCGIIMFIGSRVNKVKGGVSIHRILTGTLVALTALMSISAFTRIVLLVDTYGLSNARLFGAIFLIVLLTALLLYFYGYLRNKSLLWYEKISSYLLVVLVLFFLIIPTDLVVGYSQIQRAESGKQIDYEYLLSLSEEAQIYVAPKLLDRFDSDGEPIQYQLIRKQYSEIYETLDRLDLRSMNFTRLLLLYRLDEYNLQIMHDEKKLTSYMEEYMQGYVLLLKDEKYEEAFEAYWSPSYIFSELETGGEYELIDGIIDEPISDPLQEGVWSFLSEPLAMEVPIKFKFRDMSTGEEKCITDQIYLQLVGDEMMITNSLLFTLGHLEGEEVFRVSIFEFLDDKYNPFGEDCDY